MTAAFIYIIIMNIISIVMLVLGMNMHKKDGELSFSKDEGWGMTIFVGLVMLGALYTLVHNNLNLLAFIILAAFLARQVGGLINKFLGSKITKGDMLGSMIYSILMIVMTTVYYVAY